MKKRRSSHPAEDVEKELLSRQEYNIKPINQLILFGLLSQNLPAYCLQHPLKWQGIDHAVMIFYLKFRSSNDAKGLDRPSLLPQGEGQDEGN
ncbi:MAG: hypothetical protein RPU64_10645 [Candidatus Sedimenticola sp. (ex Thyasira tokunagai)]